MRMLGLMIAFGLLAGLIPAVGQINAEQGILQTTVAIYSGDSEIYQLTPGQDVNVKITVKNVGDGVAVLSNCIPPPVHLYVYDSSGELVDKVIKRSEIVVWTMKTLSPGETYTTTINWQVPFNFTGGLYTIEAKVGNSPAGSVSITVVSNSEAMLFVVTYTDNLIYYAGEEITIHMVNLADVPVTFGAGFYIVSESGETVISKIYRHVVTLQPGEEITYTWNCMDKNGEPIEPGIYYIYSYANENPAAIIIL